ncbi:hypothetical protein GGX14DRAFT_677063 [Mycena pura]|uniref:Uncharacterized protein n=1 Tax=Mycena pura TaxID=153505 RepID=A0AAD6V1Y8_9AGAR|nr:hypothetical protein GGX14DRAFT_677063 [Mycena pura]
MYPPWDPEQRRRTPLAIQKQCAGDIRVLIVLKQCVRPFYHTPNPLDIPGHSTQFPWHKHLAFITQAGTFARKPRLLSRHRHQLLASPQACAYFEHCCRLCGLPALRLRLWVRTRWTSLYACLDRDVMLRKAIDHFVLSADESDDALPLRSKQYSMYKLSRSEWDKLTVVREALREPTNATQSFSSERTPTVYRVIPTLEFLIKRWETMAEEPHLMLPRLTESSESLIESDESSTMTRLDSRVVELRLDSTREST